MRTTGKESEIVILNKYRKSLLFGGGFFSVIISFFSCVFLCFVLIFFPFGGEPVGGESVNVYAYAGVENCRKFPKGTSVCGVAVGGEEKLAAFVKIREEERRRIPDLRVVTSEGTEVVASYEIDFTDDLEEVFLRAKRGGSYETKMRCFLKGEGAERLIAAEETPVKNACVQFGKNGFVYEPEKEGRRVDRERFFHALEVTLSALARGERGYEFPAIDMRKFTVSAKPSFTMKDALKSTQKLSSFTTEYSSSGENRSKNIELAAAYLTGCVIESGETLSFNERVGYRTKERGFKEAKIIQSGEFVLGVGGGVCQVSTTLFNAALLSGLEVTERRNHSLSVSYVQPSRDAAVSAQSDLKICNPFPFPVYVSVVCAEKKITVTIYGTRGKRTYSLFSKVTEKIEPPPLEERKINDLELLDFQTIGKDSLPADGKILLRAQKCGIKSRLYRDVYEGGKLVSRKLLFSDSYAPVRGIVGLIDLKNYNGTGN